MCTTLLCVIHYKDDELLNDSHTRVLYLISFCLLARFILAGDLQRILQHATQCSYREQKAAVDFEPTVECYKSVMHAVFYPRLLGLLLEIHAFEHHTMAQASFYDQLPSLPLSFEVSRLLVLCTTVSGSLNLSNQKVAVDRSIIPSQAQMIESMIGRLY